MELIKLDDSLKEVEESRAKQIKKWFEPMVNMLESFEEEYERVLSLPMSKETAGEARALRLKISRVRIDADKERAKRKKAYLIAERAIQGVYNILKNAVTDKEQKLADIENYYENLERERIENLRKEREIELAKYEVYEPGVNLGEMSDEAWKNYLTGTKTNYETRIAAEKKAEEDRLRREEEERLLREAEKAELLRLKKENEKLAKEKEEALKKAEAEEAARLDAERAEKKEAENTIEKNELSEMDILGFATEHKEPEKLIINEVARRSDKQILTEAAEYLSRLTGEAQSQTARNALIKASNTLIGTTMML